MSPPRVRDIPLGRNLPPMGFKSLVAILGLEKKNLPIITTRSSLGWENILRGIWHTHNHLENSSMTSSMSKL